MKQAGKFPRTVPRNWAKSSTKLGEEVGTSPESMQEMQQGIGQESLQQQYQGTGKEVAQNYGSKQKGRVASN